MDEDQYITQEGLDKLKSELHHLKNVRRHEIASRIERAKELGDLSENAEYAEAKDEQAFNEGKIIEIEEQLKKLVVVEKNNNSDIIDLGSKVRVDCNGKEKFYTLVSFNEVDPVNNMISNESPLGQAMIGRKVGDEFSVKIPSGQMKVKILEIE
ncbi:MAG: transcription elongation factor GreA [bacterium]|nr:transcription elongation factor GreA [bacterium]